MNERPDLLAAMMEDQSEQPPIYRPSPYWSDYCQRIAEALRISGVTDFRGNYAVSKGFSDTLCLDPSVLFTGGLRLRALNFLARTPLIRSHLLPRYLGLIDSHYRRMTMYRSWFYEERFGEWIKTLDLPQTTSAGCQDSVEIGGQRVSKSYIIAAIRIHNCSRHIDLSKVCTVLA